MEFYGSHVKQQNQINMQAFVDVTRKAKRATRINLRLNMQQTYIPQQFHKPQPHLYLIN